VRDTVPPSLEQITDKLLDLNMMEATPMIRQPPGREQLTLVIDTSSTTNMRTDRQLQTAYQPQIVKSEESNEFSGPSVNQLNPTITTKRYHFSDPKSIQSRGECRWWTSTHTLVDRRENKRKNKRRNKKRSRSRP
jgi:hypothetical protein